MNKNKKQTTDNQDYTVNEGFDTTDEYPNCEGESCDNSAEKPDNLTDEGTQNETTQNEAAEWKDKYTRLVAEYDNYRKRTLKEKLEIADAGGQDVIKSMLDVLDDMDRALAAIETASDMEAVKQGIMLIDNKLRGALKNRGLSEIEAVGHELDTDLHEAVARIETAEDAQKGKIIDVVQKGYKLKEKIIRYAKVVVGQ